MKTDLDRLMGEAKLEALWVTGPGLHNPPMSYFTGLAHLTDADLIKRRGQAPVLFYASMERGEAAATGLAGKNTNDYHPLELLRRSGGDRVKAAAALLALMFRELGVRGRVALYGSVEVGVQHAVIGELQARLREVTLVAEGVESALLRARATKDEGELERMRRVAKITTEIMGMTAEFLATRPVKAGHLIARDGSALTVRRVKSQIALWLAERGLEDPEGVIFAPGRDGGLPHSTGGPDSPIELGKPIVFDFFPQEAGGGYFFDITRTWCLGRAPKEVEALHNDVLAAYTLAYNSCALGMRCRDAQRRVCDFFESQGHPTPLSDPQTEIGYCHSLGHGVGLNVHESPHFTDVPGNDDRLQPGTVFTLEPGLYYPDHEMGMRLEDTLVARADGTMEVLGKYPMDLVVPMRTPKRARAKSPARKR